MSSSVLVINAGSSSLKYQLFLPDSGDVLASGVVERIGESSSMVTHHREGDAHTDEPTIDDHGAALKAVSAMFDDHGPQLADAGITAVGHRVVHGGATFSEPVIIDEAVRTRIDELSPLAPLHNPPSLDGIDAARRQFPDVPHVAVFDTAFFSDLPAAAATYAIPPALAQEHRVRKYGFHGTSHEFVSAAAAETHDRDVDDPKLRQIVLHLGNGCSASAIRGGKPVETSMGLTPLQGLVMGTRSGDIDPGLHAYLNAKGMSLDEIDHLLNKESGLKGLAGENDFRELQRLCDSGDAAALLAFDIYVHRIKLYVGGYLAVLGGADMLIFTGGVGENSAPLREAVLHGLEELGFVLDSKRNAAEGDVARTISTDDSRVEILVVPTNEELAIARDAAALAEEHAP